MVKNQLAEIARAAEELNKLLAERRTELQKSEDEKEKIQRDLWSARKENTALKRIADDFDEVDQENASMRDQRKALKTTLQTMLKQVKALSAELRSS